MNASIPIHFLEVVTGDPRYFRRAQWGRLITGEDVVAIVGGANDDPILPKAHVRPFFC